MNIPEQVKNEARALIEQYGDTFEYLGIYEGQEAYVFKFPEDSCTGYPFVYLYDGKEATEITGPLSLDVIDSCIENIEEGDIESPPLFQPILNSYTPSSLHTSLKYSMYLLGVIFRYPLCATQLFILICCTGVPSMFFQTSKARPLLRYSSFDPATLPLAVISHPLNRKAYAGAQV